MSNGKDKKIDSATALIKMSQHFPKPYKSLGGDLVLKLICRIMQQKQIQNM